MSKQPVNPGKLEFDAMIFKAGDNNGCGVKMPFTVQEMFGVNGQVKVVGTFDGEPFRTSIAPYSTGNFIVIKKDVRAKIGKEAGDTVRIVMELDTAPRIVDVPEDFKTVLKEFPAEEEFFKKISFTHQKEYVNWINDAKKQETRERRILKAVEMMREGKRGK
ncbi:MAG: YdeI/OmpD-associated family protein [Bacteroidota bacterium]